MELEQVGVNILRTSGRHVRWQRTQQLSNIKGYFVPQAAKIKKAVKIPVIGVGGIRDAEYADELVRDGLVDLVAVGRALLKDSKWAEKAIERLQTKEISN